MTTEWDATVYGRSRESNRSALATKMGALLPRQPRGLRWLEPEFQIGNTGLYNRVARSRSALTMTDTELNDIASAATTGLSSTPNPG
jgi:hypothetical protein